MELKNDHDEPPLCRRLEGQNQKFRDFCDAGAILGAVPSATLAARAWDMLVRCRHGVVKVTSEWKYYGTELDSDTM